MIFTIFLKTAYNLMKNEAWYLLNCDNNYDLKCFLFKNILK
jgi:hypothetical protein